MVKYTFREPVDGLLMGQENTKIVDKPRTEFFRYDGVIGLPKLLLFLNKSIEKGKLK